jgi:hypothetical protein
VFGYVEVLRVVKVRVETVLDAVDHTRLKIDQESTGDVVLIIRLIEKHIFPIVSLSGVLF